MANVIYVGNEKGGVSKTTTTINLARAIQVLTGELPALIDSDPSKGLTKLLRCAKLGWQASYVSDSDDLMDAIEGDNGSRFILIDGGAQISNLTMACTRAANTILILVQPSPVDLVQTADYLSLVKDQLKIDSDKKAAFVLSMHDKTNITKALRPMLANYGLPVIDGLSKKGAYKDSLASGVTVFEPYKDQLTQNNKRANKEIKEEDKALAKAVAALQGIII